MDSSELQKLAERSRSMREAGITLLLASGLLALFLFIPYLLASRSSSTEAITATATAIPDAFADVFIEAKAAIVYDLSTGETLYAKNADAQLPLASLTKLLTVYAALTTLPPPTSITIPAAATKLKDDLHTFSPEQTFTLSDLARLTLTASLNDGAAAIAMAVAEDKTRTESEMLASAATALDLTQTYAVNGSGLDVHATLSGSYGSARDVALLAGAFIEQAPDIAQATTQSHAQAVSEGGTVFTVMNTNPMVDTIPRLLLSKTGFTELAGGNLVLVFDSGIKHPIAVVVLGSSMKARFTDSTTLIAATLAHFAHISSL